MTIDQTTTPSAAAKPQQNRRATWQFLLVTGGRIALVGSWFLATRLLAVTLGPAGFGIYFLSQYAIRILTGCIGDPLDMAVMAQVPLLLRDNRARAVELLRSAFWLRVGIAILLLLAAVAAPALASRAIFASPEFRSLAMLTVAGVLGDFLLRSALGYFQVDQKFNRFLAVDAVWQLGRVAVVVVLVLLHKLTAPAGVLLYVVAPYVSFAFAWPLLPADVRMPARPHRGHVTGILKYSGWIAAGLAIAAVSERLDAFILEHFRGKYEVGIYGGAVLLASIPDFLDGILQTVLAPKIAPAHADGTFGKLQMRYLTCAVPCGLIAMVIAWLLSDWGIHQFFNASYANCAPAFRLLLAGTLFNLVFTTMPAALVNYIAPKRSVVFSTIGLIAVTGGSIAMIPRYGATGAAAAMLLARLLVGGLVIAESIRLTRSNARTIGV